MIDGSAAGAGRAASAGQSSPGRGQSGGGGSGRRASLQLGRQHALQLDGVGGELADALGELVGGHLVLVQHPAERRLVHVNLVQVLLLGCRREGGGQR